MSHLRIILATTASAWLWGSVVLCPPAAGRDVKLVLRPQKASAAVGKFFLLPPESAKVDGDAEVEEFIQGENAPNLYISLSSLPRPFVEMENAIEAEKKAAGSQDAFQGQIDEAQDRCRMIAKRFDRSLAALQCVEAIRSYSASHSGKLPKNLAEILEVPVPTDPLHDASFQYSVTGSTAVLESAPPAGDGEKGRIRYEISVRN